MKRFTSVKLISFLTLLFLGSMGTLAERADGAGPRFIVKDHTVEDRQTGLCWTRNANPSESQMTWYDAVEYLKELNRQKFGGNSDWRLPAVEEMRKLSAAMTAAEPLPGNVMPALILEKKGFKNVQAADYWTSTSSFFVENEAWFYSLASGAQATGSKWLYRYVWPVRWDLRKSYSGAQRDEAKKHGKKDRITQTR